MKMKIELFKRILKYKDAMANFIFKLNFAF